MVLSSAPNRMLLRMSPAIYLRMRHGPNRDWYRSSSADGFWTREAISLDSIEAPSLHTRAAHRGSCLQCTLKKLVSVHTQDKIESCSNAGSARAASGCAAPGCESVHVATLTLHAPGLIAGATTGADAPITADARLCSSDARDPVHGRDECKRPVNNHELTERWCMALGGDSSTGSSPWQSGRG